MHFQHCGTIHVHGLSICELLLSSYNFNILRVRAAYAAKISVRNRKNSEKNTHIQPMRARGVRLR
ncbi:hypothetical protein BN77_3144 [Rhizobium mesoamericanum STM3625]|uniref:Uncharacterized protein n=1 Tax=Rhizobium mesoamericanum STM3625 TaxID=1211777 RepID=K0PX75_9HYPH|nr:hypothetical protein BN77_3144 [Rhizobium mesoamericanum STM3625]